MYVAMTRAEEILAFTPVNLERLCISDAAASRPRCWEATVGKPRLHFAPPQQPAVRGCFQVPSWLRGEEGTSCPPTAL